MLYFILFFAFSLALGILSFFVRNAYQTYHRQRQVLSWTLVDVSDYNRESPEALEAFITTLTDLGFVRLGEYVEKPPNTPLDLDKLPLTWVYIDSTRTTCAEAIFMGEAGKLLLFSTRFSDEAYLETSYPKGESFTEADSTFATIDTSLTKAQAHHAQQGEVIQRAHGEPQAMTTMTDFVAWDSVYRQHHLPRKINAFIKRQILLELMVTLGLLFFVLGPILLLSWLV